MVDTNFTLVSGTYTTEQHLLSELDFFMVNTIGGWSREKVVTDTATDKNIAYYNDGTISGTDVYDRLWVRIRATGDELRFNGMSYFNPTTDADSDTIGVDNLTELSVISSGTYWFAANTDAVHVLVERASDGLPLHGGFGYLNTYLTPEEDPKPVYVFGQYALNMTFASDLRLYAYGPHSWGSSYNTTQSGIERGYAATHPTQIKYGTPNPRSGYPKLVEPVFLTTTFGVSEVRGEVPGVYMCGGAGLTPGGLIEINNMYPTVSGMYLIHKHSDDIAWAIGPVTVSGGV